MPEGTRVRESVVRRADRPGDLGWIVMAHGELYHRQFGWNTGFESLVAKIVAEYAAGRDQDAEAAWIAEVDGERAGCVMLVADDTHPTHRTAKLRTLLVTPAARGLGTGTRLVAEALAFARAAGYRSVSLWTTDNLVSARRIYQSFGFTLTEEQPHRGFGHDLVGQTWTLEELGAPQAPGRSVGQAVVWK
ncbi:GNAT family N-acetyltransferase [Streptomyces sp. NBC_00102]|uniref:GNAT family N-acetyltransferase n=1 Tax=Streptomyces sp. NBC_00102 TaxID=2975652 RepID=UPI002256CEAC|nr:GNAT family N-acetyltransferase [Streptomyces sp. NBC_00102]MCX5396766.1 GNAT family N-acetyltransferase [Streptomyces sp. NBC_00102]